MARRGVEIQVLERGVPVARLVGMPRAGSDEPAAVDRLVGAGVVRRGMGGVRAIAKRRLTISVDLSRAVADDRVDRA
jgi:antitoxin (DNA-binding transcriptional repressor) of toxin-antitoxin stability system